MISEAPESTVDHKKTAQKFVYSFGSGAAEGDADLKNLLGGKGANLHAMTKLGLTVPPGFTITTEVCTHYYQRNQQYPKTLEAQVEEALGRIEASMNFKFGDSVKPLLVSVRSGARSSMPGMMDTILNLGLNDATVRALAALTDNERFAYDSYRRFVSMYAKIVLGLDGAFFEKALDKKKREKGATADHELSAQDAKALVEEYKSIVMMKTGKPFPQDPKEQLWGAVGAVFGSWMKPRAVAYRKLNHIPESWGTAVNVQCMVFGNMGEDSATGVAFTRDPASGEKEFFGEFLVNAQGEDVVAGIRTPQPINAASQNTANGHHQTLETLMPALYGELAAIGGRLEKNFRDMQDIEFTIQQGRLYILQCRNGKRTAKAALKMAVDMVHEGLIDKKEGISRVRPEQLEQLLHPTIDPKAKRDVIGRGLPASPGAASGAIVFDPETAERWVKESKKKVILVRVETSPEDIVGMNVAQGILTARGGMTSHAAVVARGMGKCCVVSCAGLEIDENKKEVAFSGRVFKEGDDLTLDGATGEVMAGVLPTVPAAGDANFTEFMGWADEFRRLGVRANADTPKDAAQARSFGAEGIGLCRTEHMFFEPDRITAVREMILAKTAEDRERALHKIFPMQKQDFVGILKSMRGFPVTIRLLDPPLHEFLPHGDQELKELADDLGISVEDIHRRAEHLKEFNPMLGFRGCRLGVIYPEIYSMQAKAIMEAAAELAIQGVEVLPEIMIPLVGYDSEFEAIREDIDRQCRAVLQKLKTKVDYKIGTMIELPRACLVADRIAKTAEFFSFGTNDLTQMTLGISRDDAASFIGSYVEKKIFATDPFSSLDQEGVGALVIQAVKLGRQTRKDLKIGICGEHGGDPASVHFFHKAGLDYVSCSPFRVPVARLAAAQAALSENE
ncbi:MAG: pyruvate, phosphate dikinase [Elusimicrobia bacterium]|nr:pyruvate, phosphate dikinase [Elusimicrobiota bacterium]